MQIERVERPSPEIFERDHLRPERPVVITGAMEAWAALGSWNCDYLAFRVGHARVPLCWSQTGDFSYDPAGGPRFDVSIAPFQEALSRIQEPPDERSGVHYVQCVDIPEHLRELLSDIEIPRYIAGERPIVYLWIGQGGNTTGLHYDGRHNLLCQVQGQKHIRLFDPEDFAALAHCPLDAKGPGTYYSLIDASRPDLERFPELIRARPLEVTLSPGEMLFIPALWWHHVRSIGINVAVSFWWGSAPTALLSRTRDTLVDLWKAFQELPPHWQRHLARLVDHFIVKAAPAGRAGMPRARPHPRFRARIRGRL
jgi:lysine-specific demethylase 8